MWIVARPQNRTTIHDKLNTRITERAPAHENIVTTRKNAMLVKFPINYQLPSMAVQTYLICTCIQQKGWTLYTKPVTYPILWTEAVTVFRTWCRTIQTISSSTIYWWSANQSRGFFSSEGKSWLEEEETRGARAARRRRSPCTPPPSGACRPTTRRWMDRRRRCTQACRTPRSGSRNRRVEGLLFLQRQHIH